MKNKWDKDYKLYRGFDMGESFFVEASYLKSKHGRGRLSNFFSKQSICELQHLIRDMVRVHLPFHMSTILFLFASQLDQFCDHLKAQNRAGQFPTYHLVGRAAYLGPSRKIQRLVSWHPMLHRRHDYQFLFCHLFQPALFPRFPR
jgi:hypothetical protein